MATEILIIVTGDPRSSPRPAEAVRVAAGVGVWQSVRPRLFLQGPAVLALSADPDALVDAENYQRYLPIIAERGDPIWIEAGTRYLSETGGPTVPYEPIGWKEVCRWAARSRCVLRF